MTQHPASTQPQPWGYPVPPPPPRRKGPRTAVIVAIVLGSVVAVVGLLLVVFAALGPPREPTPLPPESPLPSGAPLASGQVMFDSDRGGNFEVYVMRSDGGGVKQVTNDPAQDSWWPQVSADRRHLLFYRVPRGLHDKDYSKTSLWVSNVDGSEARELLPAGVYGWAQQGHAMWSPDGKQLVMFAGSQSNPQLWVTDVRGRNARALTDRPGVNLDPAWSPDGASVTFVGCPERVCLPNNYEIYVQELANGRVTRVTDDDLRDHDPVFAPDGKRLAWLTQTAEKPVPGQWNVRSAAVDGSEPLALTSDGNINSRPAYTPDGKYVYFHRLVYGAPQPKFQIWRVDADGSHLTQVGGEQPGNNEYPVP